MQCSQFMFVCVCMYICMYIRHTLIRVGSLFARVHRHDMHVVMLMLTNASDV